MRNRRSHDRHRNRSRNRRHDLRRGRCRRARRFRPRVSRPPGRRGGGLGGGRTRAGPRPGAGRKDGLPHCLGPRSQARLYRAGRGRGAAGGYRLAGALSLYPRAVSDDVSRAPLDHAPDRRLRHRRRHQPPVRISARAGADGAVHRFRHAHADGLRLRPPHESRRGGPRGSRGRHHRRHGGAVRRHRPARHFGVDDDQPVRLDRLRHVYRAGAAARLRPARPVGHHPGRHPQGIHGAEGVDIPHPPVRAPGARLYRLGRAPHAPLQPHKHFRLPYFRSRSDGGAGSRLHHGQHRRLCGGSHSGGAGRRRVRPPPVVLFRGPGGPVRGSGEVPRRAPRLCEDHEGALRREEARVHASALPCADGGGDADEAPAPGEPHAHRLSGARGGARRLPKPARQRHGRSLRHPHRGRDAARPAHPAGHRRGNQRDIGRRSPRRLLVRRNAHARHGAADIRDSRPGG